MFSLAHVHLLLNHLPIILTPLGLLFLLIAAVRRQDGLARVGLSIYVGGALMALPTYLTGEPAEDVVRHLPDVTRTFIHNHEAAALPASLMVGALGVFALWALWADRRPRIVRRWVVFVAIVWGALGSTAMARTGLLGGEIRHSEFRPAAVIPN